MRDTRSPARPGLGVSHPQGPTCSHEPSVMNRSHPRPFSAMTLVAASIGLLVVAGTSACTQGSAPSTNSSGDGKIIQLPPGSTFGDGFDYFIGDSHKSGDASTLKIGAVVWGRLVDVFDQDPATGARQKLFRDLLVDPLLESDPQDYLLEINPVTLREELTIRHAFGSTAFDKAFDPLRQDVGLQPFLPKGISPGEFPPFTAVPRNAAIAILFDDLLDPDSVSRENVNLAVGYPPTAPQESRIIPDRSHGALLGSKLYSTRVIIDLAVSESEAQAQGIGANPVGLPGAINALQPNGVVRIPTKVAPTAAQFSILQNLSGHGVSFTGNGPADAGSPTLDVLRGFRSGGPTAVTQDPYEGFLQDKTAPQVIGSQRVLVTGVVLPARRPVRGRRDLQHAGLRHPSATQGPDPGRQRRDARRAGGQPARGWGGHRCRGPARGRRLPRGRAAGLRRGRVQGALGPQPGTAAGLLRALLPRGHGSAG